MRRTGAILRTAAAGFLRRNGGLILCAMFGLMFLAASVAGCDFGASRLLGGLE